MGAEDNIIGNYHSLRRQIADSELKGIDTVSILLTLRDSIKYGPQSYRTALLQLNSLADKVSNNPEIARASWICYGSVLDLFKEKGWKIPSYIEDTAFLNQSQLRGKISKLEEKIEAQEKPEDSAKTASSAAAKDTAVICKPDTSKPSSRRVASAPAN